MTRDEAMIVLLSTFMKWQHGQAPVVIPHEGFVVLAHNQKQAERQIMKINNGDTKGIFTVEEFAKSFLVVANSL